MLDRPLLKGRKNLSVSNTPAHLQQVCTEHLICFEVVGADYTRERPHRIYKCRQARMRTASRDLFSELERMGISFRWWGFVRDRCLANLHHCFPKSQPKATYHVINFYKDVIIVKRTRNGLSLSGEAQTKKSYIHSFNEVNQQGQRIIPGGWGYPKKIYHSTVLTRG